KAQSDSFKLDKEAVKAARENDYGIVIISASRDYGLDDLLFGPKEYHLIRRSDVPLLLVNPRGDLYTLCD
ncbi:MAG TPA: universal stress protein, partial [Paludibacteraceae bacterium]|nr:universal stress protein [Paludibacteraceae bacterium]